MGRADVVVIGGGVLGTACAYQLARRGVAVTLLERGGLASGTSRACQSGIGFGLGQEGFDLAWSLAAMAEHAAFGQEAAVDYVQTDGLLVCDPGSEAELADEVSAAQARGAPCHWLDRQTLRETEPVLAHAFDGAAYLEGTGEVSPMRLAGELARRASAHGAEVRLGVTVEDFVLSEGRIVSVRTSDGSFAPGAVVVAAGVWSREVAGRAGDDLPVWPLKGNVLVTEPVPGLLRHYVSETRYEASVAAVRAASLGPDGPAPSAPSAAGVLQPLPMGPILIGSSRGFAGFDRTIDRRAIAAIAERARSIAPALAGVRIVRSYAGLRPWTPDGRPFIGPSPRLANLWYATGHAGEGNTGSLLSGRLLGDLFTGAPPVIDPGPVSPARLAADPSRVST